MHAELTMPEPESDAEAKASGTDADSHVAPPLVVWKITYGLPYATHAALSSTANNTGSAFGEGVTSDQ